MAANYLYGPGTIEMEGGARPVKTVESAVIGPIGTTLMRDANTLVQCLFEKDAAAFGSQFTGFTIPQTLDAIYDHGADTVPIINVLDPAKHKTAIEDEVVIFDKSTGQARLAHPVVASVVVKNSEGNTAHTASADYRVDAQAGVFTSLSRAIETGGSMRVSHECVDPSKVTVADTIDGMNSARNRTGMELLNDSFSLYDCLAKILIASVFCTQKNVVVEFIVMAEKLGAITHIDAPTGITFTQALTGRGPKSTTNFNTSSDRVRLYYSHAKVCDLVTNAKRLEPFNQHAAGLRARVNLDKGYWWSPLNQEILGIAGVKRQLSMTIDDPQSEVNLLNGQGIATVFSSYGSGSHL